MAEFIDNCGYWLYSGSNDVPKTGSSAPIKPITGSKFVKDLNGDPLLFPGTKPLADYSDSRSVPRIFTRAEKGQALTHLEMDFNLASLLHKANTSSCEVSKSIDSLFDPIENSAVEPGSDDPNKIPYYRISRKFRVLEGGQLEGFDKQHLGDLYPEPVYGSVHRQWFGPYPIPEGYTDTGSAGNYQYYNNIGSSTNPIYKKATQRPSTDPNAHEVRIDLYVELQRNTEGIYPMLVPSNLNESESFCTCPLSESNNRVEFLQLADSSSELTPETYGVNGATESFGTDVYFERHKPVGSEEFEGLFATFSYAPIKNGDETIIQNAFQTIKVQHTTNEIRYKLANEQIPGTFHIREDFSVTGSAFVVNDVFVTGSTHIVESLAVSGSAFVRNNLVTSQSLYVLANAYISGLTDIGGNTHIVGETTIDEQLNVKKNISGSKNLICQKIEAKSDISCSGGLRVDGASSSLGGGVRIQGDLYVDGYIYGNIYGPGYNSLSNPNYATEYSRFGTQDTGSQSDARLKLNPMPIWDPLYKLGQITGYEFEWAPEAEKQGHDVGLIAQELQAVLPDAVGEGQDGYLRIDYTKVVPLLVEAVKKLREEVEWLRNRVQ